MTDKQIIIDKHPDCEYYNFSLGGICDQTTLSGNGKNCAKCSDIDGCFIKELYKQLKHKEQECEELKKTIMYKCPQCGEVYLSPIGASLYEENKKLKQTLTEIKEITEPYKMTIKKICGNCKKYDDCYACCYKDINCYKYTSSKTDACEEFTCLDEFIPNLLANSILQKIRECETENE